MQTYLITFITLDGNKQQVFIDAHSETRATMTFECEYQFDEIISVIEQ